MVQPEPQTIEVRHPSDVGAARRAARTAAERLGFEPRGTEEIALAMTELATNLLKHARGGRLILTPLGAGQGNPAPTLSQPDLRATRPNPVLGLDARSTPRREGQRSGQSDWKTAPGGSGRVGLQIESIDHGPGIANVEQAITDGYSTAGSRGTGLGAVNRLMDEFDIVSRPGSGTRIVCRKWRRVHPVTLRTCPLAFGVATRPRPGYEQNGDGFVVKHWSESVLVGVIDGLGHGQFAHRAAETARQYVESHYDTSLAQLFLGVSRACRATRGVVMALARFDWGQERVAFASVGDIKVRALHNSERLFLPTQRGILGLNAPTAGVTEHTWLPTDLMVIHSDGLHTHWSWKEFPGLWQQPASLIAQQLLRRLARDQDDATVLVVRKATP